ADDGPFPAGAWEACRDAESSIADADEIAVGIDMSVDRSRTFIAFAGLNQRGNPHVEIVAAEFGHHWVFDWLTERYGRLPLLPVAGQGRGAPVSDLLDDLSARE